MHDTTIRSAFQALGAAAALGCLALAISTPAQAGSPGRPPGHARHHHAHGHADYYVPYYRGPGPRYVVVDRLPRDCRRVVYRGQPYYYRGSEWYRPYGVRYVAVAPPAGPGGGGPKGAAA